MSSDVTYVVTTKEIDTIVVTNELGIVVAPNSIASTLLNTPSDTVLSSEENTSVVVTGLIGPQGLQGQPGIAEDDMPYSKKIDFVTESELYTGEAAVGSLALDSVWRIKRTIIATDSDVEVTWASGTASFDKVWATRATYTYI
jgi:hypothetical protein